MAEGFLFNLNSDLGEDESPDGRRRDLELLEQIDAANIACGFHAGSEVVALDLLRACRERGIAAGAHVSYQDREGFGRRRVESGPAEVAAAVGRQLEWLGALAARERCRLTHLKPHGALYHDCADPSVAAAVAVALARFDPGLVLVGEAGGALAEAAAMTGTAFVPEGYCDRAYSPGLTLLARELEGALVTDPEAAAAQALGLARDGRVRAIDGSVCELSPGSLCIHSDTPGSLELARTVRARLLAAGGEAATLAALAGLRR
ncbi:MAG: 5-oxoprolinase subunit PxpA [Candidatus Dormibacteria bacterium]